MTRTPETVPLTGVCTRLDTIAGRWFFLVAVVPVLVVFFATSTRSLPVHIDPFSNSVPAWNIAANGSVYLDDYAEFTGSDYFRSVGWFVAVEDTAVSQYPPGAALWGSAFYLPNPGELDVVSGRPINQRGVGDVALPVPPLGPAALAASMAAALAVGWLALTFRTFVSSYWALMAAWLMAFGTSTWNIAADRLWQHAPAMMWLALGGYLMATAAQWGSGVAHGLAILTRPVTAVIAAGTGIAEAWTTRSWRPAVRVGVGATTGLAALVAYNAVVFGEPSISGGYPSVFVDNSLSSSFGWYAGNILRALVDPTRGLLVWAPFLLVLIPGLRAAWLVAPGWVRGGAVGSAVYLLIQYKANRFSGGDGFYGYRYPLEALVAAAPLLLISYREWVITRSAARQAFALLAVAAVALQGVVAIR